MVSEALTLLLVVVGVVLLLGGIVIAKRTDLRLGACLVILGLITFIFTGVALGIGGAS